MQSNLFAVKKKTKHHTFELQEEPKHRLQIKSQMFRSSPGGNLVRFIDAFQDIDHDALIGAAVAENFLVVGDFADLAVKENWKTEKNKMTTLTVWRFQSCFYI